MKSKQLLVMIAAAGTLVCGAALASDIYRYVDDDGNVSYGDRPSGEPTEQRMALVSQPTDNAAVQASYNARYGASEEEEVNGGIGDSVAEEEPMTRAQRVAAARERADQCDKYRTQLETLISSRRLFREDAGGERTYLEEAEVQQARDKAQELVVENCD